MDGFPTKYDPFISFLVIGTIILSPRSEQCMISDGQLRCGFSARTSGLLREIGGSTWGGYLVKSRSFFSGGFVFPYLVGGFEHV